MTITPLYEGGQLTMTLSGELDHHSAKTVLCSIDEYLDEYMPRECVLDLSGVNFMDSSGIAIMIRMNKRMKIMGGRTRVINPSKQAMRVIDASGLERILPVDGCGCLKEA